MTYSTTVRVILLVLGAAAGTHIVHALGRSSGAVQFGNPASLPIPEGYSNLAVVRADAELVFLSGQTGEDRNGNLPEDIGVQYRNAVANIEALLRSEGMTLSDIVKLDTFVVAGTDTKPLRNVTTGIDAIAPTATLVYVSRLAQPSAKVELQVIAARRPFSGE